MNGDVVFDPRVLGIVEERIRNGQSFVCVDRASVAEEEVKYTLGEDGMIKELSKTVVGGLGEAVGINYVSADDKAALIVRLDECDDQDYFERGIELAIEKDGLSFEPVDISEFQVVEVDFDVVLSRAIAFVSPSTADYGRDAGQRPVRRRRRTHAQLRRRGDPRRPVRRPADLVVLAAP